MRPPGYEPGELPTAPLRDLMFAPRLFPNCECKGSDFFFILQIFEEKNALLYAE